MIPKIIHYCWFGGNPLPELAVKCIDSWQKFFPDYEIKEWNESNFDLNCCDYVREAYEAKKWAFVSDYARFWILYRYGGLYFDTDVEIIKSFDDVIDKGPFMGCESWIPSSTMNDINMNFACNPGLGLAATPHLDLYKEVLEDYESDHFTILEKGGPPTVVERTTKILLSHGLKNILEVQQISDIYIYPPEYFCPMNYITGIVTVTDNTRSIHHYTASWLNATEKKIVKIQQRYAAKGKAGCAAEKMKTFPLRVKNKINKLGFSGTVRFVIKKITRKF